MVVFTDRVDAGRQLAARLEYLRGQDLVVLGLPRGGVPVAYQVAKALEAPLDVIVVRKLGIPFQPEVAMGAIGEGGARVLDTEVIRMIRITDQEVRAVENRERAELEARVVRLRRGRDRIDLTGRTAVVVDDGMATGATARVACLVARRLGASRVILAVPVASPETVAELTEPDEIVCVATPPGFSAVGYHYRNFAPTSDEEVIVALDAIARRRRLALADAELPDSDVDVAIPAGSITMAGHLHVPEGAAGVVVFAHGSGSSRHSPRNRFVASVLYEAGLGTLLLDLLTPEEEVDRANVFDIGMLAARLAAARAWLADRPETADSRIGYFGASTGAGAALWAASEPGAQISAVVSRGGRPDLAGPHLPSVDAPTLLIVGSADEQVLELNRQAQAQLRCVNRLSVVHGATHLFEEPGTLAEAAILARDWFTRYLLGEHAASGEGGRR